MTRKLATSIACSAAVLAAVAIFGLIRREPDWKSRALRVGHLWAGPMTGVRDVEIRGLGGMTKPSDVTVSARVRSYETKLGRREWFQEFRKAALAVDQYVIAGPPPEDRDPGEIGFEIRGEDFVFRLIGGRFGMPSLKLTMLEWSAVRDPYSDKDLEELRRGSTNVVGDRFFAVLDDGFIPQRGFSIDLEGTRHNVLEWDGVDGTTPTFQSAVFDADDVLWWRSWIKGGDNAVVNPGQDLTPLLHWFMKLGRGK